MMREMRPWTGPTVRLSGAAQRKDLSAVGRRSTSRATSDTPAAQRSAMAGLCRI